MTRAMDGRRPRWSRSVSVTHCTSLTSLPAMASPERRTAEEVDQYIVILGASVGVGEDAVEDVEDFADFDGESGFFEGLAGGSVAEFLAEFEDAAGNGPFTPKRLGGTSNQQGAVVVDDDGSDADDGMVRVVAFHGLATG